MEAYVGEYASGKSEVAVNRALSLLGGFLPVTLVDLDLVEPAYTLRPLKAELESRGLTVIAWETSEDVGLGEAGMLLKPEARWALKRDGHVILDVGYGVHGSRVFNLLEGYPSPDLKVLAVVNIARPMTSSAQDIADFLGAFEQLDGLINNSSLGEQTDLRIIQQGAEVISEAGRLLGIPVVATTAEERFRPLLGSRDLMGHPVRYLHRFMQHAVW